MTTKEKYEMIDKTKVSPKTLEILEKMQKASSNFTNAEVTAKIDTALDKLIEGFKASKPEALLTVTQAKKEVKKEKEQAIKKNEGKDFSDKKDTDDKSGLPKKDTVKERTDIIKKDNEPLNEARERAKKELEKEKEKAKDFIESQLDKLNRIILEDPALQGFNQGSSALGGKGLGGKSDPLIDAERKAMPRGSRISRKGWKNQWGESLGGRKYWENRENRSDRKSPEYETGKPYLDKGGNVAKGSKIVGYEVEYEKLVDGERDRDTKSFKNKEDAEKFAKENYSYVENVYEGQYTMAEGGYMADGGIVVTSIKDIPNFEERLNGGEVKDMYSKFELNKEGNFSAVIDNKNYEIIYRDDKSQLYDLFENGKKIKSSKVIRDLMQFPKYANGGGVGEIRGGIRYVKGKELEWHSIMSFDIADYGEEEAEGKAYNYIQENIKYWNGELNENDFVVRKSRDGKDYKGSYVVYRQFPKYAKGGYMADGGGVDLGNNFNIIYEKPNDDVAYKQTINANSMKEAEQKFYAKHPTCNILNIREEYAKGGYMANGGIVVTSIKDIPNFEERLNQGRITYRGLGVGKLSNDFFNVAGEGGVMIKVDGKEYYITDTEFNSFSRDAEGILRVKFSAPKRKFAKGGYMADGGNLDDRLSKMMSAYEILEMLVKGKIAGAVGMDEAIRIMENDYEIHPFRLIQGAVRSGLLELDEINKDLVYSALMEAERIDEDYRDSGQGIGSSDITYFTKSMLDDAGYKTGFINNRLARVDADGNELVIDQYKMNFS